MLRFPKICPLSFCLGILSGIIFTTGMVLVGFYETGVFTLKQKAQIGQTLQKTLEKESKIEERKPLTDEEAAQAFLRFRKIKKEFIPSGIPAIYGKELNISFDKVQDAINKVMVFGPTYGEPGKKIKLKGKDLKRYIDITSQTSCRYCCGAKSLVFENGEAACGCAHSIMMRGLAAYLIKNHPGLSDKEILAELNKWQRAFFPKQTLAQKLLEMEEKGETGIEEILREFPEFLPQMVGGC